MSSGKKTPIVYEATDPAGNRHTYHSISDPNAYLPCGCFIDESCHIKTFKFSRYRGFVKEQIIDPAIPNGAPGSGLSILVGGNNTGKSTVLEAITQINPKRLAPDERLPGSSATFAITNCGNQISEQKTLKPGGYDNLFSNFRGADNHIFPKSRQIIFIPSPRIWQASKRKSSFVVPKVDPQEGLNHELFHGELRHYTNESFQEILNEESYILRCIQKNKGEKEKLNSFLRQVLPGFNDWYVSRIDNKYEVKYIVSGKMRHSSDLIGTGLKSLIKIFCYLIIDRPIILLDEPEYGLHPQAQKKLSAILSEESKFKQIIIATHSPYFINQRDFENGATLFKVGYDKAQRTRKIYTLGTTGKEYLSGLKSDWHKPEMFDAVAREIFFTNTIVFTEGKEDVALLHSLIHQEQLDLNFELFGYGAHGAADIINWLQLASELGIDAGAIFDDDPNSILHYETCISKFGSKFVKKLPTADIRDKPRQYGPHGKIVNKSKVGVFTEDGKIKPEYKPDIIALLKSFNFAQ